MAATRLIEVERGTFIGFVHSHNGYYAGDFNRRRVTDGNRGYDLATTDIPMPTYLESPEPAPGIQDRHRPLGLGHQS